MPKDNDEKQEHEAVSLETVKDLVDSFKDTVKEVASRPVNVTVEQAAPNEIPTGPTPEERAAKYAAIKEQANAMAQDGDTAGAMEAMWGFVTEESNANRPDPSNDPAVKSLMQMGERLAKSEHGKVFEKYGDEIKEYVAAQPADKRISPDVWEEAIGTVKTRHFDEVLQDAIDERVSSEQNANAASVTLVAGGSRGARGAGAAEGDEASDLTPDEQGVAKSMGISDEAYARNKKEIAESTKHGMYPLLETDDPKKIERGKF